MEQHPLHAVSKVVVRPGFGPCRTYIWCIRRAEDLEGGTHALLYFEEHSVLRSHGLNDKVGLMVLFLIFALLPYPTASVVRCP